jgi:hypothetical protein
VYRRGIARPSMLHLGAIVALASVLVGCSGKPPPATYPVKGKITYKGGKAFAGGIVTFTSKATPANVMDSPIGDDGSFELGIVFDNRRIVGGVPGPAQVMISSRFAPAKGVEIYILPQDRTIEPRDNDFAIEVDPATAQRS